jgi:lipin, N-terminal conserved region
MAMVKLKGGMSLVYNNIRYYFDKMNLALFSGTLSSASVLHSSHGAQFSAAVDVVVVEGPDGTLRSTPFLVCFSTYKCLTNPHEKVCC